MLKPLFLRIALGLVLSMLFFEGAGQGSCGFENFDNSNIDNSSSYVNGSFMGNNGVTWTYVESRDENGDPNGSGIDGKAIMLRRVADYSRITSSTISGGISDFSVKLYKGFTGAGNRQVELFVNGVLKGTSAAFDDFNEHIFSVSDIDIAGDVIIEIRNSTSRQIIVDDISWDCYPPVPSVQFESTGVTISENGSFVELCVDILNPDPITDATVDIELTGTGSPHVNSYTTANLTFPAGSSDQQCVTITIADDIVCGNSQNYIFTLVNEGGPADIAIGSQNAFTLGITDDDSSSGTIVKQGFEEDATETFAFTNINGGISTGNDGSPNNQRIRSGSKSFQVNDQTSTLNFNMQDISSFTNVQLELWNSSISLNGAGNGADGGDFIRVYVSETATFSSTPNVSIEGNNNAKYGMNGNLVLNVTAPATISHITPSYGTLSLNDSPSKMVISIPDAWNSLYAKIEIINNTANEVWCLDDIRLSGITCDACVDPTITSINPTSGPKETVVNIIGTNFITGGALTDVQFGGVSASSYTVISDTELTAVVPADVATGVVKVVRGACNDISTDIFTFLEEDCETGTASLIISELCDSRGEYETDRYIEIYNPSDVSVNLDNWTLYALINESNINNKSGTSWALAGTIAPGQAMTCGYTSPVNGGPHTFTKSSWNAFSDGLGSFSWNGQEQDGAALYNGTTIVDAVLINPGINVPLYKDRVLLRNSDVCESNPNSPLSEWSISDTTSAGFGASTPRIHSSCVLLTNANSSEITIPPSSIAEPICNQPDLTLTATSSSEISYQWYYNDGSALWTEIIDNAVFSGATTPALLITNLIGLEDYQFYCRLITDLACINYSRAIQVDVLANDKIYFKSSSSGLWSDPATWDFSDDLTNYSGACLYPTKASAELIEIESGQTVTFDLIDTDTLPSVWVLSGGTLQTQSNRNLIIDNVDPTAELIVDGTFIDNATSGSSISFLNGATWELGAAGTIVKTNTSSVTQYRDNYESGIDSIPATANWIYRKIGPNDISVATIGMVYPNLLFENELLVGSYTPTSSFHIFSGNSSSLRIKGDLRVGQTGVQPYNMTTINTHINPILIEGDLYIGAGSSLTNTANGLVGTGFEVQGDIDITGILDLSAGSSSSSGILKLSGGADAFGFNGITIDVNHLVIDKDPGFDIHADLSIDIKSELTLTSSILELAELANTVILPQGIVVNGGSNASHIDGFVSKSGTENFRFPIGDDGYYQPIGIFDLSETSTFRARYVADAHPNAGPYYDGAAGANGISEELGHCDYWTLNRPAGSASAKVILTYGNTPCNVVTDENYLNMAKWDGLSWEYPVIGVDPTTVPGEISSTIAFPTFSDFVLASNGGANINVLPIKLTSFTATPENYKVKTAWTTETETNNAFFTVERSADARVFQEIGRVTGAGTSHTARHYTFTDERPLSGLSYYRLKQTDFDGHFSHSDIVAVAFTETSGFSLDLTYRDENELNLVYTAMSPYILVEIFDVLGKRVYTEVAENDGGRSVLNPNLGRGAYVVRISSGDKWDSGKIVW